MESLREKLRNIYSQISIKFMEKEINSETYFSEYLPFVNNLFKEQNMSLSSKQEDIITDLIEKKIGICRKYGLDFNSYYLAPFTPISPKAEKDIEAFENFKTELLEHLKETLPEATTPKEYCQAIKDYVEEKRDLIPAHRKKYFAEGMSSLLKCHFTFVPDKPGPIADHEVSEIEEIINSF